MNNTNMDIDPRWAVRALEDIPDGVLIEEDEQIAYINPAYVALLGYRRAPELVRQHVSSIIAPADAPRLLDFGRLRTQFGATMPAVYDFAALRRDGGTVRLHASVATSRCEGRTFITTIVRPAATVSLVSNASAARNSFVSRDRRLSSRETEVMVMMIEGKRLKEIGMLLNISVKTVTTHRARLLRKLGVEDNRGLFEYAVRYGLVDWTRESAPGTGLSA